MATRPFAVCLEDLRSASGAQKCFIVTFPRCPLLCSPRSFMLGVCVCRLTCTTIMMGVGSCSCATSLWCCSVSHRCVWLYSSSNGGGGVVCLVTLMQQRQCDCSDYDFGCNRAISRKTWRTGIGLSVITAPAKRLLFELLPSSSSWFVG